MALIKYINKRFSAESLSIIKKTNEIIDEYAKQGLMLTLRQIYYQFVAKALIENSERSYKRIGSIINDGRLAGYIDWAAIEDRTRNLNKVSTWRDPASILRTAAESFRYDKWEDQDYRIEVWIEKDALLGVIEKVCNKWDIPYFSCRGYTSQSEMWKAAERFGKYDFDCQNGMVFYFGDHDPSGLNMTDDIINRFNVFKSIFEVDRLALNMNQIEEFNPPPNPTKLDDSRAKVYIEEFGLKCWELDALNPEEFTNLIEDSLSDYIDMDLWDKAVERENEAKSKILKFANTWKD